jgi:hypothetical protein
MGKFPLSGILVAGEERLTGCLETGVLWDRRTVVMKDLEFPLLKSRFHRSSGWPHSLRGVTRDVRPSAVVIDTVATLAGPRHTGIVRRQGWN